MSYKARIENGNEYGTASISIYKENGEFVDGYYVQEIKDLRTQKPEQAREEE